MSLPAAMSMQGPQTPHGSGVGPFSQFSARARMRADVVFPQPRGPVNKKACATRPVFSALIRVRTTCSCPVRSEKRCGRYFRARTRYGVVIGGWPKRVRRIGLSRLLWALDRRPGTRLKTLPLLPSGPGGFTTRRRPIPGPAPAEADRIVYHEHPRFGRRTVAVGLAPRNAFGAHIERLMVE